MPKTIRCGYVWTNRGANNAKTHPSHRCKKPKNHSGEHECRCGSVK